MNRIVTLVIALVAVFVVVRSAEAQRVAGPFDNMNLRQAGAGYDPLSVMGGGGYGGGFLGDFLRIPEAKVACDLNTLRCHSFTALTVQTLEQHMYVHGSELLGTFHGYKKGRGHFRAHDETNRRIGTIEGGALGALGGMFATAGMQNRGLAGLITVGAAAGGGVLASRNQHDNCIEVEVGGGQMRLVPSASPASTATAKAGTLEVRNETEIDMALFDGTKLVATVEAGESLSVAAPKAGYKAIVKKFNDDGTTAEYELGRRANGTSLVFSEDGAKKIDKK